MSTLTHRSSAPPLKARIHFPPWSECMAGAAASASDAEEEEQWRDGCTVEFRPSGDVKRNHSGHKHIQVTADVALGGGGDHSAAATTVTGSSCSRSEGVSLRSSSIGSHAPLFDSVSPVSGAPHWSHRSQGSGEQQLLHSMRELSRPFTRTRSCPHTAQPPRCFMHVDITLVLT